MAKLKEPGVCRIFFSSPFNGMEGEREDLTRRYWPEIQALCNSKGLQFVPVDMRWGITTELSNNNQTINICLREIDRSDMFVGFFGQRYGWHGEKDEALQRSFDAAVPSYPWIEHHRGKSVTELEFLHGHLNNPGKLPAVICFREKNWDDGQRDIGKEKGDKRMIYKYSPESDHATNLMDDLKGRVKSIDKQTLGVNMAYKTPEEGAKFMSDAIMKYLNEVLLKESKSVKKYSRELELDQHDAFCNTRTSFYVRNEAYNNFLNSHMSDPKSGILLIHGNPGVGKTALLCSWLRELQKTASDIILVYHFVGSTNSSTDMKASICRIVKELSYQLKREQYTDAGKLEQQIEKKYDELQEQYLAYNFKEILTEISQSNKKAVIIIDGLEKATARLTARPLYWLPTEIPEEIKVILSTQSSDHKCIGELKERWQVKELLVEHLTPEQQKLVCQETLKVRGKELSDNQMMTIADAKRTQSPLFLKIVLEELCMFGKFRELDKKIESLVTCQSSRELFGKYLERMEEDYNSSEYPGNLIENVMCALYISRTGFTESDIMEMLQIPQHLWSLLYYGLQNYIIIKLTLIQLAYAELKEAVFEKYIKTEQNLQKHYKIQMEFYYNEVKNNWDINDTTEKFQKLVETLHCAYKCDNRVIVLQFITSPVTVRALASTDARSELLIYLRLLNKSQEELVEFYNKQFESQMVKEYVAQMEDLIEHPNVVRWLMSALDGLGDLFHFAQYHIALEKVLLRMKSIKDKNPEIYPSSLDIDYQLGSLYMQMKEPKKALPYLELYTQESLKLDTIQSKIDVGHGYHSVGNVYMEFGDHDKAEEYFSLSEEQHKSIPKEVHESQDLDIYKTHASIAMCKFHQGKYEEARKCFLDLLKEEEEVYFGQLPLEHSHTLTHMGMVYRFLKNMPEAEKCYTKAMEIKKKICGDCHIDVAIGYINLGNFERDNHNCPAAVSYFSKALQIMQDLGDGESHTAWIITENLMHSLILQGKYDEAYEYYPKVYEYVVSRDEFNKSLPTIHFTMAQVMAFHKGKPEEGYKVLRHLINSKHVDGDYFFFLDRIARELLYKGQSPLPIPFEESLEKCILLFPSYMPAWEAIIGEDLVPTKNTEKIIAKLEDYYKVNGGYNDEKLLVLICQICQKTEWLEGVLTLYEHFTSKFPGNEVVLRNIAVAYGDSGQVSKCIEVFEELITINPDIVMFYDMIIRQKFKLEDYDGCKKTISLMQEKFSDNAEVQEKVASYTEVLDEHLKSLQTSNEN